MQSTSSSAEPPTTERSATEALAAKYRYLFVLPRASVLVTLGVMVSLPLSVLIRGGEWPVALLTSSVVLLLSASAVSSALLTRDRETIATFRRVTAMLFASQLLWLIFAAVGAVYSFATSSTLPLANAVLFAAFTCTGFEFLVINGAFTRSTSLSVVLSLVHPVGTFLVVGLPMGVLPSSLLPVGAGLAVLAIITAFPLALRRWKTSHGSDVVTVFQAFMKTWTSRRTADLEAIVQEHAEAVVITTKVMRFRGREGDLFLIMPGVHPGPFFPVGSYNLPAIISKEFSGLGPVMTLHRPGGHERNLASNSESHTYAAAIRELAERVEPTHAGTIRGPAAARIGNASVSSTAFAGDLLLTISFAPLGSDDLEPRVEDELSRIASDAGFEVSVVDAHNSIGPGRQSPDTNDLGWRRLLDLVREAEAKPVRIAYAHSSETSFSPGDDLTENGIGLLMLEAAGVRSVLVLADANNALPLLRGQTERALEEQGYRLIEFCTSDSHDLAAKGLTVARGYEALGEDTPVDSIAQLVVSLARLAEPRLSPCLYGSGRLTSTVNVFGSAALEEFASLAQASSSFTKKYWKFAAACTVALFAVSLMA